MTFNDDRTGCDTPPCCTCESWGYVWDKTANRYMPQDEVSAPNPKTLTGRRKTPMLSVIPPTALIQMGEAMRYGAYEAPKVDGTKGYGPYNWRDQDVEIMTYVDAAIRHLLEFTDGQWFASDSKKPHLAHAMASIGILMDAIEYGSVIDNRPNVRREKASGLLEFYKVKE